MAIGDITINAEFQIGDKTAILGVLDCSGTYVAGGIDLALGTATYPKGGAPVGGNTEQTATNPPDRVVAAPGASQFTLASVDLVLFPTVELAATTALIARYDAATDKVMMHEGDGPTTAGPLAETDEAMAAATDVTFLAIGTK